MRNSVHVCLSVMSIVPSSVTQSRATRATSLNQLVIFLAKSDPVLSCLNRSLISTRFRFISVAINRQSVRFLLTAGLRSKFLLFITVKTLYPDLIRIKFVISTSTFRTNHTCLSTITYLLVSAPDDGELTHATHV